MLVTYKYWSREGKFQPPGNVTPTDMSTSDQPNRHAPHSDVTPHPWHVWVGNEGFALVWFFPDNFYGRYLLLKECTPPPQPTLQDAKLFHQTARFCVLLDHKIMREENERTRKENLNKTRFGTLVFPMSGSFEGKIPEIRNQPACCDHRLWAVQGGRPFSSAEHVLCCMITFRARCVPFWAHCYLWRQVQFPGPFTSPQRHAVLSHHLAVQVWHFISCTKLRQWLILVEHDTFTFRGCLFLLTTRSALKQQKYEEVFSSRKKRSCEKINQHATPWQNGCLKSQATVITSRLRVRHVNCQDYFDRRTNIEPSKKKKTSGWRKHNELWLKAMVRIFLPEHISPATCPHIEFIKVTEARIPPRLSGLVGGWGGGRQCIHRYWVMNWWDIIGWFPLLTLRPLRFSELELTLVSDRSAKCTLHHCDEKELKSHLSEWLRPAQWKEYFCTSFYFLSVLMKI